MMKKLGVAVLFFITVAVVGGSRLLRLYNPESISGDHSTDLYLHDSTNLSQLSKLLVDSLHVAKSKQELRWAGQLLGWRTFRKGHYRIHHAFTYNQFLSKLAKGNQNPISVTIPPGQSKKSIFSVIIKSMQFDSTSFYDTIKDSTFLASKKVSSQNMVGHLFPDTYQWYWTSSPKQVLNKIFSQFNLQVQKLYQSSSDENMPLPKVITMASIIEGEALHNDEKPKISGLYWNRLHKNMYLQADPTVIYAVGSHRRLYFKDYKVKSPYNTYVHKGLPPGPINNPSISSIRAVLHPKKNDYLYMVAKPDGYHAFSKSYAKHEQQSKKWRKYLQRQAKKKSMSNTDSTSH